jgi:putative spermidine/putrescine transport system substrate-binding protein
MIRIGPLSMAALAVSFAALLHPADAQARDFTVTAWGGSSQAAQRKLYYDPYTQKTGTKILEDSWSGGIGILRTKVKGGNAAWDMVQVESDDLELGCEEGLFEKIDWKALGPKDRFIRDAAHECGVGSVVWTTGLVYDADRLKEAPRSWADFWDVSKFPSKRTLRKTAKYTLEFALLADGVAPADVYKVLRTPAGVDRAFKKLDQIKSNVVWWSAGAQGPQLLASGEAVMGGIYTSRALSANKTEKKNFRVVWPGSVYAIDYFVVLKGSPHKDKAMQLLKFMTQPEIQKDFPIEANQGITTIKGNEMIDPAAAVNLPSYPPNQQGALKLDAMFWIDNGERLTQRFNAWASQ